MNKRDARKVIEEFTKRFGDMSEITKPKHINFDTDLFDKQRALLDDPAKRKAALAGRRSGKSISAAYYLIKTAYESQRTNVAYVALSRKSAKKIIWSELLDILERYGINHHANGTDLDIELENGSMISVSGANNDRELDKHRGMSYSLFVVDECGAQQFMPLLENLIEDIVEPSLMDTDGTLLLISTPGIIPAGYFYEVTAIPNKEWSVHKWNISDNPKLPRWSNVKDYKPMVESLFAEVLGTKGWTTETPKFVREYKGEWVLDSAMLIYPFTSGNTFKNLPDLDDWQYMFGVDLGVVDASTIVVGAYSSKTPNLYIVDTFKMTDMAPSDFADVLKNYFDKYEPTAIIADSGGLGKAYVAEVEKRFSLPIQAAMKSGKIGMIELLADDFRQNKIKIHHTLTNIKEELYAYEWKDKRLKLLPDADEHLLDALLYMWRHSIHFIGEIKPYKSKLSIEDQLFEEDVERVIAKAGEEWWEEFDF